MHIINIQSVLTDGMHTLVVVAIVLGMVALFTAFISAADDAYIIVWPAIIIAIACIVTVVIVSKYGYRKTEYSAVMIDTVDMDEISKKYIIADYNEGVYTLYDKGENE